MKERFKEEEKQVGGWKWGNYLAFVDPQPQNAVFAGAVEQFLGFGSQHG
jgi:hypothetical protein